MLGKALLRTISLNQSLSKERKNSDIDKDGAITPKNVIWIFQIVKHYRVYMKLSQKKPVGTWIIGKK